MLAKTWQYPRTLLELRRNMTAALSSTLMSTFRKPLRVSLQVGHSGLFVLFIPCFYLFSFFLFFIIFFYFCFVVITVFYFKPRYMILSFWSWTLPVWGNVCCVNVVIVCCFLFRCCCFMFLLLLLFNVVNGLSWMAYLSIHSNFCWFKVYIACTVCWEKNLCFPRSFNSQIKINY